MARAISGVYAWFDSNSKPQLIARREKLHQHEGREFAVFELASCNRCGEVLLVGEEKGGYLVQPPDVGDDPIAKLSWYRLGHAINNSGVDEDDAGRRR